MRKKKERERERDKDADRETDKNRQKGYSSLREKFKGSLADGRDIKRKKAEENRLTTVFRTVGNNLKRDL